MAQLFCGQSGRSWFVCAKQTAPSRLSQAPTRVGKHAQPRPRPRHQQAAALGLRQHVRPPLLAAQLQAGCPRRLPALHGDEAGAEGAPILHQLQGGTGRHQAKRVRSMEPLCQPWICGGRGRWLAQTSQNRTYASKQSARPDRVQPPPPMLTTGGMSMSGEKMMGCSLSHSQLLLLPLLLGAALLLLWPAGVPLAPGAPKCCDACMTPEGRRAWLGARRLPQAAAHGPHIPVPWAGVTSGCPGSAGCERARPSHLQARGDAGAGLAAPSPLPCPRGPSLHDM